MTYRLYSEPLAMTEVLDAWVGNLENFTHIVGQSAVGHIFAFDPARNEYGLVYPLLQRMKNYGPFASVGEFEAKILADSYVRDVIFEGAALPSVVERVGPLQPNEVYFPVPYPFLGGTGAPDTYEKGDIWVFYEIVGQMLGLKRRG